MDDLAAALGGFAVSQTLNDTNAPHPRYNQYKQKSGPGQNERRRRILEEQKKRRFDAQAHIRALYADDWASLPQHHNGKGDESMDTDSIKPRHPGRYYRDQLMLSEWMIEVPENFEEEWTMVACPVGKRCLIIAGSGYTSAYRKSGQYMFQSFQSTLPGGCHKYYKRSDSTILDCIYSEVHRTFYILDMMCWNDLEVYNTETEFRIFWLRNKIDELEDDISTLGKKNEFHFVPLLFRPCDKLTINRVLETTKPEELDGLLFYHKSVHYLFGTNPLCLWLQAYMLKDVLGMGVSDAHMNLAPANYQGFQHHLETVKNKKEKREAKEQRWKEKKEQSRRGNDDSMESNSSVVVDNAKPDDDRVVMEYQGQVAVDAEALQAVVQPLEPKKSKSKKKNNEKTESAESMQTVNGEEQNHDAG